MKFLIYDQLTLKNQERKKNVGNKIQLFLSHLLYKTIELASRQAAQLG
jgi:hypothetical protein